KNRRFLRRQTGQLFAFAPSSFFLLRLPPSYLACVGNQDFCYCPATSDSIAWFIDTGKNLVDAITSNLFSRIVYTHNGDFQDTKSDFAHPKTDVKANVLSR
ncbi:MAG: hypothetical protein JXB07_09750, partial [Anaerolineae bacterium]|nr:hypothetical protein [Anaerolineae bacterium]